MALSRVQRARIVGQYVHLFNRLRMRLLRMGGRRALSVGYNFARLEAYVNGREVYARNAFSHNSLLPVAAVPLFVPTVSDRELGTLGISNNHQTANHTEPKLFHDLIQQLGHNRWRIDHIKMISLRPCCPSCLQHCIRDLMGVVNLARLSGAHISVTIIETNPNRIRAGLQMPRGRPHGAVRRHPVRRQQQVQPAGRHRGARAVRRQRASGHLRRNSR